MSEQFEKQEPTDIQGLEAVKLRTVINPGRSQNTVPIASTQVVIKGIVQYSTRSLGHSDTRTLS